MPNSATLVQALGAAFCAILCALSGMGGGGMMIGSRVGAWAKSGGGSPDYEIVTNQFNYTNQLRLSLGLVDQFGAGLFIAEQPKIRNNMTAAMLSISGKCFRYRGGVISLTDAQANFDADVRIGDRFIKYGVPPLNASEDFEYMTQSSHTNAASFLEEIIAIVPSEKLFLIRNSQPTEMSHGHFFCAVFYNGVFVGGIRCKYGSYGEINNDSSTDLKVYSSTKLYCKMIDIDKIFALA